MDTLTRHYGGTAPNIAYSHALLGGKPALIGTAGDDFNDYRQWLESKGVDTKSVKQISGKMTASFFANTDKANLQIASFYPGAMAHAPEVRLHDLDYKPDLVVISPDDPVAMRDRVRECVELKIPYLYDPSQQLVRLSVEDIREGIENAKMIVVNDYEAHIIQDRIGLSEADMVKMGKQLIVTRGKDGATVYADGQRVEIRSFRRIRFLIPPGRATLFRGGFLRGLALGLGWEISGKMGALAATYCLEKSGTQNHAYTVGEFVNRFREVFEDQGKLDQLLK